MNPALNPDFGILIVDDEPAWLRALSLTLESSAGITNVFLCEDSRKALPLLSKGNIGLVILDLTMPHISGEEILASIAEQFPETACIIISGVSQLDIHCSWMRHNGLVAHDVLLALSLPVVMRRRTVVGETRRISATSFRVRQPSVKEAVMLNPSVKGTTAGE